MRFGVSIPYGSMIPRLKDILTQLEKIAPKDLAEPWDNSGLQVGSLSREIRVILVGLDPTLRAVKSAQEQNAQLLLTHHPLIFEGLLKVDINTYPGDVIVEAVRTGLCIVSAHTNLDYSPGGVSDILANLLRLGDVEVLKVVSERDDAGLGRIGDFLEPIKLSVLAEEVKHILGVNTLRVVGNGEMPIRKVAVVGGSGGSLVSLAARRGADLLLTGDVSHHHALEALSFGMALIDGGHYHTEKAALRDIAGRLESLFKAQGWKVRVDVDEAETSPMRYV